MTLHRKYPFFSRNIVFANKLIDTQISFKNTSPLAKKDESYRLYKTPIPYIDINSNKQNYSAHIDLPKNPVDIAEIEIYTKIDTSYQIIPSNELTFKQLHISNGGLSETSEYYHGATLTI